MKDTLGRNSAISLETYPRMKYFSLHSSPENLVTIYMHEVIIVMPPSKFETCKLFLSGIVHSAVGVGIASSAEDVTELQTGADESAGSIAISTPIFTSESTLSQIAVEESVG